MNKEEASWTKNDALYLIGRKQVDPSVFIEGTVIPSSFHADFENANDNRHLNRRESEKVILIIGNQTFNANLLNVDREIKGDTLKITYGKKVQDLFKKIFASSHGYIQKQKEQNLNKKIVVPEDIAEYIEFYETGEPFKYSLKLIPVGNDITQKVKDPELVEHIFNFIKSKGFYYEKIEVENLFLSLKTKPFVILSGISGTGKTMMVKWFAESLGATKENGQFTLIPVRPDWSDGSDLLGYRDIKGEFISGPLTKVLLKASENLDKPYFILLDEMNLARVEYYFSDFLSVMESREWINGTISTHPVLPEEILRKKLGVPENVYILGTVNMDETTFPFSKKVLDRANTIEFNRVALDHYEFLENITKIPSFCVSNSIIKGDFLHLKDAYIANKGLIHDVTNKLIEINSILEKIGAHVGYRVRDEICFYMIYNKKCNLLSFNEAFDYQILQKILPRLSGSDHRILNVLKDLYTICTSKNVNDERLHELYMDFENAKYPMCARKLVDMLRRFDNDGFTSFWISG